MVLVIGKKNRIQEIGGFKELADKVIADKRSLLYYDRLYILYQAICNVRHLASDVASIAEIGVYRGSGSHFIASVAQQVFSKPPKMHAIDTFEGHPDDIGAEDDSHWPGKFGDTSFEEVQKYLSVFPNLTVYKGRFEERCVELKQEKFCFVHVDVDIYTPTRACLEFFSERLLLGGVIVADDYGFTTCEGSKQAVDEFVASREYYLMFHLGTGQSLFNPCGLRRYTRDTL
jgi:O-methyltransferase